jgi:hypothetical protein
MPEDGLPTTILFLNSFKSLSYSYASDSLMTWYYDYLASEQFLAQCKLLPMNMKMMKHVTLLVLISAYNGFDSL